MTAYPPMSFTDIIEFAPRIEALAEPHVWVLPRRDAELDADRIIATYQQTTRDTLAAMRYETPRLTALSVICDIVQAIREKYARE